MKPLNSSKSHRLFDFVPSVKPSVVSVILVFVCGVLWVKNETTNERLIALESRLHCFSCVKSLSTENLDKMTPSPTKILCINYSPSLFDQFVITVNSLAEMDTFGTMQWDRPLSVRLREMSASYKVK